MNNKCKDKLFVHKRIERICQVVTNKFQLPSGSLKAVTDLGKDRITTIIRFKPDRLADDQIICKRVYSYDALEKGNPEFSLILRKTEFLLYMKFGRRNAA